MARRKTGPRSFKLAHHYALNNSEVHIPSHPTPGNIEEEHFLDFAYKPHTVSGIVIIVSVVIHKAFLKDQSTSKTTDNIKDGLITACLTFLFYCMLQLRDGILMRPHPAVWRVIHGCGIIYLISLVFLLCQPIEEVPKFLSMLDPRIGEQEVPHSYGSDCRLYITDDGFHPLQNLMDQFFDRFTIAHFLGWYLKALILRDWALMWIASVFFEVLEVSLQHIFPNFNECWWDHLFLDVFGCNLLGMWAGMKTVSWLNGRKYDWSGMGVNDIVSNFGKMRRVALQFTPHSWTMYRWQIFSSWRRALIGLTVLVVLLLGELNAFFLKSVLFIPIDSNVNLYRLSFWVLMTYMCVFEYFNFAEGKAYKIGSNAWLATVLVLLELILVVKHAVGTKLFTAVYPEPYIVWGWAITILLFICMMVVKITRKAIVWSIGAQEVSADAITGSGPIYAWRKFASDYSHSIYVSERLLNRCFQYLSYALPIPFAIVLLIDCMRTLVSHPPNQPVGFDQLTWWNP